MPQYEYRCKTCGFQWTEGQTIEDRDLPLSSPCSQCFDSPSIIRVITPVNFKIRGYSSKNGYSKMVGDIEKHLGREITSNDLDD